MFIFSFHHILINLNGFSPLNGWRRCINHVPLSVQTWDDRWDVMQTVGRKKMFQKNIIRSNQGSSICGLEPIISISNWFPHPCFFNSIDSSHQLDQNIFINNLEIFTNQKFRIIASFRPSITCHSLQMTQMIDFLRIRPSIRRSFHNLPRRSIAEMTQ